ncbi:MAG: LytTR family DNA-binding domain-containing protein [bacterium]
MKIKCICIDDEPLALMQISSYIKKTPFLELVGECQSAFEAFEIMKNHSVQLMFIDINMPDLSGMEFVKSLAQKPNIVFTTAYSDYAVEGFEVDAADYLLKPISYNSFLKAANKVLNLVTLTQNQPQEIIKATRDHLFVKSEYKIIRIEFSNIKYIESMHEYIKIHLINDKPIMTMTSLKSIEEHLPSDVFMRVHRSFIVNLSKISIIERNRIIFDSNVYIPISEQYKKKFQEYLDKYFLN